MKSKIELHWSEHLEQQRHQFTVLQYEIAVASDRKDDLIKVCVYIIEKSVCVCVCVLYVYNISVKIHNFYLY